MTLVPEDHQSGVKEQVAINDVETGKKLPPEIMELTMKPNPDSVELRDAAK